MSDKLQQDTFQTPDGLCVKCGQTRLAHKYRDHAELFGCAGFAVLERAMMTPIPVCERCDDPERCRGNNRCGISFDMLADWPVSDENILTPETLGRALYDGFYRRIGKANPQIPSFSWEEADAHVRELYTESAREALATARPLTEQKILDPAKEGEKP